MDVTDLDYELPPELIAQRPPLERDGGRLLVLDRDRAELAHRAVRDLPALLAPALFVVNDTRVLPARIHGRKPTGGRVELLLLERLGPRGTLERWLALGRASKGLRAGEELAIDDGLRARVIERREGAVIEVELASPGGVREALERAGHVPLPPYVAREDEPSDRERYQTIFAAEEGSVAAPTAGLHFTPRLVEALAARGHRVARLTLHVGAGTFRPIRSDDLASHPMHAERFAIGEELAAAVALAKREARPVVAVGTTVVRALESASDEKGNLRVGEASTRLFIRPPYGFRVVDALMTNFHLPRSTLLALVMALAGVEATRAAYAAAVGERYAFYSYGDAMLIRDARSRP